VIGVVHGQQGHNLGVEPGWEFSHVNGKLLTTGQNDEFLEERAKALETAEEFTVTFKVPVLE